MLIYSRLFLLISRLTDIHFVNGVILDIGIIFLLIVAFLIEIAKFARQFVVDPCADEEDW